ncbi:hypothetical protein FC62_GL001454 [Amylolactobacillus amylotrophicus DSM 20534]|uniref:Uncharacterized protein n=3 Tax=Amylolactobacillus TaxID=2767876 RepID=A0A1L6XCT1_9LACO|nr:MULTISPECIES: ABC transporter permease [Amylolactobacillus]APT18795.1 hypothetical protein LA20533_05770 [Amylolactobacillus amylophilus DSM 20533 = JCM 1125]KRK37112.1 hypothetical protein FC62_GL001454 [Amylolactobacillus amylotrophicus DSM 20534]KRM43429.1 hypothetical protein FD40_GL000014 [Amylolactobacillus amylophilus DSM 20533 = JCM 1125]GED80857.1 ABC transporter permease [Amylolactobacillus amylophilus]
MFLALKEMKDQKLRYLLLTSIIGLIALVVFVISGLASGLSSGNKQVVLDWHATGMVLNKNANKTVNASNLAAREQENVTAEKVAPMGIYSGALKQGEEQNNITVFGTEKDSFILPKLLEGKSFDEDYTIMISQNMADKFQLAVGDQIKVGNLKHKLKVTGIFKATTYLLQTVGYTNLTTYQELKYGTKAADESQIMVNMFAVKDKSLKDVALNDTKTVPLEKFSNTTFIENIPGEKPEQITLNAMVYVLIIISAGIVAIFMYVLTLQKKNLFGILKAQGIPASVISKSIFAQSLVMGLLGVGVAFILALVLGKFTPEAMPFKADYLKWVMNGLLLIVVATLGSIFSLPTVLKADPVESIGG